MKKSVLILLIVAGILGGSIFLFPKTDSPKMQVNQQKMFTVYETLEVSEAKEIPFNKATKGMTALDLLQKTGSPVLSGEGKNAFVTSILNRKADESKKEFWKLIINGKDAQVGAGSYILQPNDHIVWRIDHF